MKKLTVLTVGLFLAFAARVDAGIIVELTTANCVVQGTGTTYTISSVGANGGPRALAVFANKTSN